MIWTVLGTLGVVALMVAAGIVVDRRFGVVPRPRALREAGEPRHRLPPHAPGEAPETALPTAPPRMRCRACRRATRLEGDGRATYGDRELVLRRYRCTRCDEVTTIYCLA